MVGSCSGAGEREREHQATFHFLCSGFQPWPPSHTSLPQSRDVPGFLPSSFSSTLFPLKANITDSSASHGQRVHDKKEEETEEKTDSCQGGLLEAGHIGLALSVCLCLGLVPHLPHCTTAQEQLSPWPHPTVVRNHGEGSKKVLVHVEGLIEMAVSSSL